MKTTLSLIFFLFPFFGLHAQNNGPDNWTIIGGTNTDQPPYDYLYYKLVEVKNNTDRYANIINVSVQGDANYFEQQGTYQLRVDKFEGTTGRFDGIEIRTVSGNPSAATFFVFNNAVWIKSSYRWGAIFVMTEGIFGGYSPLTGGNWAQTINAPTGYLAVTSSYGLKYDFDNNRIFNLPYVDAIGSLYVDGNVGIGTNVPGSYKLAVEGTIGARKVKVTQGTWADFVFQKSYQLPSIDSVEAYIGKHQRLPDIPSEEDVIKHGLDLGEMNKNLLQKVEEQMLYIISLKKELREMREMIEELKRNK